MMSPADRVAAITACLTTTFQPTLLIVEDQSEAHRNHPGAKSGQGHFAIQIRAKTLSHQSRITAHRLIYQALGELMVTEIHALSIVILDD